MPKLPRISGVEFSRALHRDGFVIIKQTGSHAMHEHPGRGIKVGVIMTPKDLKTRTLNRMRKQAGLTTERLIALL